MAEKEAVTTKRFSADWFMRGALGRIGDVIDRFTGRDWQPSSGLATSGLIERLKALLEAEKKDIPGKGSVVPHNIKLKMQWDKFSADGEGALVKLENELLAAAADHINDRLYYTFAPLHLDVKPDYFTEGVKLLVSFDQFGENEETEMNVTMPSIKVAGLPERQQADTSTSTLLTARFVVNGKDIEKTIAFPADGRITVGRTASSGLVVDDISVSKVHASIAVDESLSLYVADTGSTNGTFLNGERIAYGKAVPFTTSDRVTFGTVEVGFEITGGPTSAETSGDASVQIGELEFRSRPSGGTDADLADTAKPMSQETEKVADVAVTEPAEIPDTRDDGGAAK